MKGFVEGILSQLVQCLCDVVCLGRSVVPLQGLTWSPRLSSLRQGLSFCFVFVQHLTPQAPGLGLGLLGASQ